MVIELMRLSLVSVRTLTNQSVSRNFIILIYILAAPLLSVCVLDLDYHAHILIHSMVSLL
jgi:hypothetical protein